MVRVGDYKLFRTAGASCLSKLATCTLEWGVCVFFQSKSGASLKVILGLSLLMAEDQIEDKVLALSSSSLPKTPAHPGTDVNRQQDG